MYDLIVAGGIVVDPVNDLHGQFDIAVQQGRVVAVAENLDHQSARQLIRADGRWVLPGLIDTHVHVSAKPEGYHMMARAGVTCALDVAGSPAAMIEGLQEAGAGLTVGFLSPLVPGETFSTPDPDRKEIDRALDRVLRRGALGVKVLGGHYPLSPEATARVIQLAHERHCWCAVHAGTLNSGSTIEGLEELVDLSSGRPVHIVHVNSYCRGQITGDPLIDTSRALKALGRAPQARSESYLALINGTNAALENGMPRSNITRTCLRRGGYPTTGKGMEEAIVAGWALVHAPRDGEIVLLSPDEGLAFYRERDSQVYVSFPVNSPAAAIALALARKAGAFVVTALSTDGGGIPRNTTLKQGLALVRFGALSLKDLVRKACVNPARMLGLDFKGQLGLGADADIVVVDRATDQAAWVVAGGEIIVRNGTVTGSGGRFLTTELGQAFFRDQHAESTVVTPDWLRGDGPANLDQ